jgi:predicted phosphodiesterase
MSFKSHLMSLMSFDVIYAGHLHKPMKSIQYDNLF